MYYPVRPPDFFEPCDCSLVQMVHDGHEFGPLFWRMAQISADLESVVDELKGCSLEAIKRDVLLKALNRAIGRIGPCLQAYENEAGGSKTRAN